MGHPNWDSIEKPPNKQQQQQLMAAAHRLEVGLAVPKHMPRRYEGAEFWPIPSALKFVVGSSNQTNYERYVGSKHSTQLVEQVVSSRSTFWTKIQASCELDYLQVTISYIFLAEKKHYF